MTQHAADTFEACLDRIRSAWNAGDAAAYAQEFTDDATYIIFMGEPFIGRESIERNHEPVFSRWQRGTKMVVKPIEVRPLGDGVMSVVTVGDIGKGEQIPFDKLQTFTFVRRDHRWFCAAFQNTRMSRASKRTFNSGALTGAFESLLGRLRPMR